VNWDFCFGYVRDFCCPGFGGATKHRCVALLYFNSIIEQTNRVKLIRGLALKDCFLIRKILIESEWFGRFLIPKGLNLNSSGATRIKKQMKTKQPRWG